MILSDNSCHPLHTLKAILVGELVRVKRNCSVESQVVSETEKVCDRLRQRGYAPWILNQAKQRVNAISRECL